MHPSFIKKFVLFEQKKQNYEINGCLWNINQTMQHVFKMQ